MAKKFDGSKVVNKTERQIRKFEKNNPQVSKALKLFDLAFSEYNQALKVLNPVHTYTSSSTIATSK